MTSGRKMNIINSKLVGFPQSEEGTEMPVCKESFRSQSFLDPPFRTSFMSCESGFICVSYINERSWQSFNHRLFAIPTPGGNLQVNLDKSRVGGLIVTYPTCQGRTTEDILCSGEDVCVGVRPCPTFQSRF